MLFFLESSPDDSRKTLSPPKKKIRLPRKSVYEKGRSIPSHFEKSQERKEWSHDIGERA
jgi:hypothetical protein